MKALAYSFILLCFISSVAEAQTKYKDLFPTFTNLSGAELKNTLKQFLVNEPDHANANFRLALVYEANYKSADPLTQYEFALANAEQAKLRFLKSKQLVDEREVSRNNEYYFPIFKTFDAKGKPNVEFSQVSQKITNGYDSCEAFITRIPPIYKNFTRSVNFYDKAVKQFADVNNQFRSLEDLYLFYDASIEKQLMQLKSDFDSAHFYFDRYMELTKAYPIAYHRQSYHIKPIVTYRLDGLITRMNFLTSDVELWDYSKWVDQVKKKVDTEISSLRTRLLQNEDKLDESLKVIAAAPSAEGVKVAHHDKQLIYNLNTFDKQSLVLALLDYKNFKQDWLLKSKAAYDDSVNHERNAQILSELIYSNRSADTLMEQVRIRLLPEKIRKHQNFLEKYYGTEEGLKKFVREEGDYILKTFKDYSTTLKMEALAMASGTEAHDKDAVLRFSGRWNVATNPTALTQELLEKGDPITLQKRKSPDGSIYLAGVYKPDKKINNLAAFLARVNPDGKPGWLKNFNFKVDTLSTTSDANNYLGPMVLTQEGVALVVRSVQLSMLNSKNTFVYINEKAEEKFKIILKDNSYPRKLVYTEKNNSFLLVLKGVEDKMNFTTSEPLTVLAINTLGDQIWTRSLDLAGSLVDLINLNDGYLLVGNYTALRDHNGKEFRTKANAGEVNPFVVRLSSRGEIVKINPLAAGKSIYICQAVKVSDNSINLLGFENNLEQAQTMSLTTASSIIHIMTDHLGNRVTGNY